METTNNKVPTKTSKKSKALYGNLANYVGEWGAGHNKERLIGNIHRNLLGVDRMGVIRPMEDLAYFLLVCQQYGLNPLKKEIYAVYQRQKVNDQWVEKLEPIVSIHGLRSLARRSHNPKYAYSGKAVFEEKEGEIVSATVEVFGRFPDDPQIVKVGEYTAYMEEFAKKHTKSDQYGKYKAGDPMGVWAIMPRVMLSKCAEANAIRMAFDIGGVYIEEELANRE